MSEAESATFQDVVEGIGAFTFRKRNLRAEIAIQVERQRLTEGIVMTGFQGLFIDAVADLKTLIVSAPDGWTPEEIDEFDPYDDKVYGRVLKVWSALRGKEEKFRSARKTVQAGG